MTLRGQSRSSTTAPFSRFKSFVVSCLDLALFQRYYRFVACATVFDLEQSLNSAITIIHLTAEQSVLDTLAATMKCKVITKNKLNNNNNSA